MTISNPRIAFMGTPDFAVSALRALCENGFKPCVVYTQPPRAAGRGQQLQNTPVHIYAASQSIPVHHPKSLRDAKEQQIFRDHQLDVAIVAAYGLILPQAILDAPKMGCVNIHASLLPRWRGAAPIQRAILAGDAETGICLMQMDAGLDTGAVYSHERTPIPFDWNAGQLHDALAEMGARMIVRDLPKILSNEIPATPQQASGESYAKKIDKAETRIDWHKSADEIVRQIRAFAPAPGAYFEYRGERIKILAAACGNAQGAPGQILRGDLEIACGDGSVIPSKLQRAGKKPINAQEFSQGFKLNINDQLE